MKNGAFEANLLPNRGFNIQRVCLKQANMPSISTFGSKTCLMRAVTMGANGDLVRPDMCTKPNFLSAK